MLCQLWEWGCPQSLTQMWALRTVTMINTARDTHGCYHGMNVMRVTNNFMIRYKSRKHAWLCKSSQESMLKEITGHRGKHTRLFCLMGIASNCSLNSYLSTYKFVQLWGLIREVSLCSWWWLAHKFIPSYKNREWVVHEVVNHKGSIYAALLRGTESITERGQKDRRIQRSWRTRAKVSSGHERTATLINSQQLRLPE